MLTEMACRKAAAQEKTYKLTDSGGLFLHVSPAGTKSWRWKYRIAGKEKLLSIGRYPQMTLREARLARDTARLMVDSGRDPSTEKKKANRAIFSPPAHTFESVARHWHAIKSANWSPRYAKQVLSRLEINLFPSIGHEAIDGIPPPKMLEVIRSIEARGVREMAHRVNNHASDVFVFAIASGLAEIDPAAIIRKALAPTDSHLRPAMTRLSLARQVLQLSEARPQTHWATLLASRLLALTAARPGVIRLAEISEFEGLDTFEPVWRIPAAKMKLTRAQKRDLSWEFVIPLSSQAADVVRTAIKATPSENYLFAGISDAAKPISDSTLSKLYRESGFAGRHVPHGWRATFSTIMNELGAIAGRDQDRLVIDLMLAHVQSGVEPIYNRAAYMPRRREIAQQWADLIMQGMPPASTLLPIAPRRSRKEQLYERLSNRPASGELEAAKSDAFGRTRLAQ